MQRPHQPHRRQRLQPHSWPPQQQGTTLIMVDVSQLILIPGGS
ncbi:MAG: hypothetical protein V7629_03545 [Motiliproteus sp.]